MSESPHLRDDSGKEEEIVVDAETAIDAALARAEELSIFPQAAARIQGVISDPESSIADLEDAVSMDITLGARLLRAANSPFYGLRREVGSLSQAIFVLGFDATRDLALALSIASMGAAKSPLHEELWIRSLRCAAAAQLLAPHLEGVVAPAEAFVAGLMQDLGCLVLLRIEERHYLPILTHHLTSTHELPAAELSTFGFSHAELSATCLRSWGLPEHITAMVRYHHTPMAAGDPETVVRAEALLAASLLADGHALEMIPALVPTLSDRLTVAILEEVSDGLEERAQAWASTLA